jgi:hypothetical protein
MANHYATALLKQAQRATKLANIAHKLYMGVTRKAAKVFCLKMKKISKARRNKCKEICRSRSK